MFSTLPHAFDTEPHFFRHLCHFSFLPLTPDTQRALNTLFYFFEQILTLHEQCIHENVLNEKFQWWKTEVYTLTRAKSTHPLCRALSTLITQHSLPLVYFESIIDGLEIYLAQGNFIDAQDKTRFHHHTCASLFILCSRLLNQDQRLSPEAHKALLNCGTLAGEARALLRLAINIAHNHCFFDLDSLEQHQLNPDDITLQALNTIDSRLNRYLINYRHHLSIQLQSAEKALHKEAHLETHSSLYPCLCLTRLLGQTIACLDQPKNQHRLQDGIPQLNALRSTIISYQIWSSFQ